MELVSIIITTYNRTRWLDQAIESAAGQTYTPTELIVVDDGSDNRDAQSIADKYPQVKYIYQKNQGLGAARNYGLEASKGTFIQFLDDDDWLTNDAIQVKHTEFVSKPELGLVYSDLYLTDENGTVRSKCFKRVPRPLPMGDLYSILVERNFIPIHSLLWKREVLEKVGGFANRSGHEDWECLLRAAEFSTFSAIDKPLGYYRIHKNSMSQEFRAMFQGKLDFQAYLSESKRFGILPSRQRSRLLTRFAFQQWAFGDPQKARQFLEKARQDNPSSILPTLLRTFMFLGRPVARWLVKARGFMWQKTSH
jgi:glycosyltransferase involved in cell wall biosynthesis